MKRFFQSVCAVFLLAVLAVSPAFAGDISKDSGSSDSTNTKTETASGTASAQSSSAVAGQPKLMVYSYSTDPEYLHAGETGMVSVSLYNTSKTKQIRNLKMTFSVEDNEVLPVEMGTKYLNRIKADGWYLWEFEISAIDTAKSGVHPATITMEYEDTDGNAYTATDSLFIRVRQSVSLSYDEPALDTRLTQGDTPSFSMNLMNTGKSTIYNAMLTFDIPGISNGGSVLVGTIESGESKAGTTNLRVDSDTSGEVKGTITLTYEDDYGKTYTKEFPVSTTVEKKVEIQAPVEEEQQPTLSTTQIAMIVAAVIVVLIIIIFFIIRAVKKKRQRDYDDRTL